MEFHKQDIEHIIEGDWKHVADGLRKLVVRDDGIFLREVHRQSDSVIDADEDLAPLVRHPYRDTAKPVLPFPFSATQFKSFCDWQVFLGGSIEGHYTNDDNSLDLTNLEKLRLSNWRSALLVGIALGRQDDDYFKGLVADENGSPCSTPQQDAAGQTLAKCNDSHGRGEKASHKRVRLLREILQGLGINPDKIKRHSGGAQKCPEKQSARVVALSAAYRQQGFTERTFEAAWERLPKID